jgi:hypothetical protein
MLRAVRPPVGADAAPQGTAEQAAVHHHRHHHPPPSCGADFVAVAGSFSSLSCFNKQAALYLCGDSYIGCILVLWMDIDIHMFFLLLVEKTAGGDWRWCGPGNYFVVLLDIGLKQGTEGDDAMQTVYRSGVGKLLHLTRWSIPDIRMAAQSLTRFGGRAGDKHLKAMHRVMQYCINTQYRGRKNKPNRLYQGDESTVHFKVAGRSDSDFASDEETRRSITGASATFEGVSVAEKCKLQGYVTLSATEAEYGAATESAQDMLFVMRLIESIGLQVEQPMILDVTTKEPLI